MPWFVVGATTGKAVRDEGVEAVCSMKVLAILPSEELSAQSGNRARSREDPARPSRNGPIK
jgi:hypothetical protein